ncbi:MAG: hypothetical protein OEZ25_01630 [Candidatus Bathyarchaeota archaeon]|nr:hypothetical protein [Candidatus Bathyarchaeota archaeon]
MMSTKHYNLHDILRVKINGLESRINTSSVDPLSFFEVSRESQEPDITLNLRKFVPSRNLTKCSRILRKYFVDEDYFYCKDSSGLMKWRFEINGLEGERTEINFSVDPNPFFTVFQALLSQNLLLKHVIGLKLYQRGYFLLHAAGLTKDNLAYILVGPGGSNKTYLTNYLLRYAGFKFLGDDGVIIDNQKNALCFPINLELFNYKLTRRKQEDLNLLDKLCIFLSNFLLVQKPDGKKYIETSSTFDSLIFLVKTNCKRIELSEVARKAAARRIVEISRFEMRLSPIPMLFHADSGRFLEYALAYSFFFPNSSIAKYWTEYENKLVQLLKGSNIYQLNVPPRLTPPLLKAINGLFGKEVGR